MADNRYQRQTLLPQVGAHGQARLAAARVAVIGCGALGATAAEQLARLGVGTLRLIDRDVVEFSNLHRQALFDEEGARQQIPKAHAAAQHLSRINSTVLVEPIVVDIHAGNVEQTLGLDDESGAGVPRVDLILDGADNAETRYLINDVAVRHGIPWIYGACVGTEGRVMSIRPAQSPCLRCIFPTPPRPGELPTCDTAGVLPPAATLVATLQVAAAMRVLLDPDHIERSLLTCDVWSGRFHRVDLRNGIAPDCSCCVKRQLEFLNASDEQGRATFLCGQDSVQVRPGRNMPHIDLSHLADRWRRVGDVEQTPFLLRCRLHESTQLRMTLFADGRLLVNGTQSTALARSIYARYVGA